MMMMPSPIGRSYDTTIPQYYPITTDQRWFPQMATGIVEPSTKRKREKKDKATPTASTTKRAKASPRQPRSRETTGDSSTAKRVKRESQSSRSESQHQPSQLPTPPSSGRESDRLTLPVQPVPYDRASLGMQYDTAEGSSSRRRGIMITRHQDEGRKLGIVGTTQAGEEEVTPGPEEPARSPRTTTIPALTTDPSGLAVFSTDQVLESELAWLEYSRGPSPPSSPDLIQLQTPHLSGLESASMLVEEQETPMTHAEKMTKRLTLFNDSDRAQEDRMVSTRIEVFGRVAVRKDVAIKFLGLDHAHGRRLVEETISDGVEGAPTWKTSIATGASSFKLVRPSWPDDEAPWALAGGNTKARIQKQEEDKAATIRRYLDNASDESSEDDEEEDVYITRRSTISSRAKGKGVMRTWERSLTEQENNRRKTWPNPQADARTALLFSLRNRNLPPLRVGKVACTCGATQSLGMGPMIECSGCRTYHHLACCGIGEGALINPQWWCPRCSSAAIALSSPAPNSTPRVYTQSDERSSAFKGEMTNIALAPSPMFVNSSTFTRLPHHTPRDRRVASPSSRQHKSRILSYGTDMWAYTEDGAPASALPTTPRPNRLDRFSTPRIEETPFDVTSTPSRHLDFNFGQPSLFSLTPMGARSRFGSIMMENTPFPAKMNTSIRSGNSTGQSHLSEGISRHDFLKDLGKDGVASGASASGTSGTSVGGGAILGGSPLTPHTPGATPGTGAGVGTGAGARWPHPLLGAHNLSPSPFTQRKSSHSHGLPHGLHSPGLGLAHGMGHGMHSPGSGLGSSGKLSSVRSSSKSGLGLGVALREQGDESE